MAKKKIEIKKQRTWTGIIYPESAPENYLEIIKETHLDAIISPLHDKDTNPDGELKKAHYHVVLIWDGPTTLANANSVMESFGAVMDRTPVQSLTGLARYLIHMDNPEKYQYDRKDVVTFGSVDYSDLINKSQLGSKGLRELFSFIVEHDIISYAQLVEYALIEGLDEWFQALTRRYTLAIQTYLKSRVWTKSHEAQVLIQSRTSKEFLRKIGEYPDDEVTVDEETGEILDDESTNSPKK